MDAGGATSDSFYIYAEGALADHEGVLTDDADSSPTLWTDLTSRPGPAMLCTAGKKMTLFSATLPDMERAEKEAAFLSEEPEFLTHRQVIHGLKLIIDDDSVLLEDDPPEEDVDANSVEYDDASMEGSEESIDSLTSFYESLRKEEKRGVDSEGSSLSLERSQSDASQMQTDDTASSVQAGQAKAVGSPVNLDELPRDLEALVVKLLSDETRSYRTCGDKARIKCLEAAFQNLISRLKAADKNVEERFSSKYGVKPSLGKLTRIIATRYQARRILQLQGFKDISTCAAGEFDEEIKKLAEGNDPTAYDVNGKECGKNAMHSITEGGFNNLFYGSASNRLGSEVAAVFGVTLEKLMECGGKINVEKSSSKQENPIDTLLASKDYPYPKIKGVDDMNRLLRGGEHPDEVFEGDRYAVSKFARGIKRISDKQMEALALAFGVPENELQKALSKEALSRPSKRMRKG